MNRRGQSGVASVEAAFAFPVIIIAAMIVMEFANIALTIDMGEVALQRAMQMFRLDDSLQEGGAEETLRMNMVNSSQGYVKMENISNVEIVRYDSLDALGGGAVEEDDDDSSDFSGLYPAWKVTVNIRKEYLTPLPRLLIVGNNEFQYRFEQVLSYLPQEED